MIIVATTSAYVELVKIGRIGSLRKDIDEFFRSNIISVLNDDGLIEFLQTPRTKEEIIQNFWYSDGLLLDEVLLALLSDFSIRRTTEGKFQASKTIVIHQKSPRIFSESLVDLFKTYSKALPDRLRGKFLDFSSGINLYNWDDALGSKMYSQIRKVRCGLRT